MTAVNAEVARLVEDIRQAAKAADDAHPRDFATVENHLDNLLDGYERLTGRSFDDEYGVMRKPKEERYGARFYCLRYITGKIAELNGYGKDAPLLADLEARSGAELAQLCDELEAKFPTKEREPSPDDEELPF